jgi:hypothetical protein
VIGGGRRSSRSVGKEEEDEVDGPSIKSTRTGRDPQGMLSRRALTYGAVDSLAAVATLRGAADRNEAVRPDLALTAVVFGGGIEAVAPSAASPMDGDIAAKMVGERLADTAWSGPAATAAAAVAETVGWW